MSNPQEAEWPSKRAEVEAKLLALDQQMRKELLARGFDPAQDENLALTAPLAKLYAERESVRDELQKLMEDEDLLESNSGKART